MKTIYFIKIWRKGTLVNDKGYSTRGIMEKELAIYLEKYGDDPKFKYAKGRRIFNGIDFNNEILD